MLLLVLLHVFLLLPTEEETNLCILWPAQLSDLEGTQARARHTHTHVLTLPATDGRPYMFVLCGVVHTCAAPWSSRRRTSASSWGAQNCSFSPPPPPATYMGAAARTCFSSRFSLDALSAYADTDWPYDVPGTDERVASASRHMWSRGKATL